MSPGTLTPDLLGQAFLLSTGSWDWSCYPNQYGNIFATSGTHNGDQGVDLAMIFGFTGPTVNLSIGILIAMTLVALTACGDSATPTQSQSGQAQTQDSGTCA